MFAHDLLACEQMKSSWRGMESMTNAPYLLPKARSGYRMGHAQVIDTCSTTDSRRYDKAG